MRLSVLAFGLFATHAAIGPASAADLTEADLAALRYFLSINDSASSEAEIARLEAEFPGADVRSTLARIAEIADEVDTSPIWRRIEAEEFAAARDLIAEIRSDDPSWIPPADMMRILNSNEGQARFEAAFAERDLTAASAALTSFPLIVTCERINNPWRLAELQREAEQTQGALATYDGILRTCSSENEVVATLQKASEIAEPDELSALFEVAKTRSPALDTRLEALAGELTSEDDNDDAKKQAKSGAGKAAPKVARAAASAVPSGSGGQTSRARAAADRGDWSACLDLTSGARSLDMISQRSWCALNFGRPNEALQGFSRVASAGGSSMSRDATYGMILAHAKLGNLQQAASLAARTSLTGQQRRVVNQTVISKAALQSFEAGQYRTTLSYLDRLSRESGLDRGLSMLRGWALLKSGRRGEAREQFRRVHQSSPGKDSQRGLIEAR